MSFVETQFGLEATQDVDEVYTPKTLPFVQARKYGKIFPNLPKDMPAWPYSCEALCFAFATANLDRLDAYFADSSIPLEHDIWFAYKMPLVTKFYSPDVFLWVCKMVPRPITKRTPIPYNGEYHWGKSTQPYSYDALCYACQTGNVSTLMRFKREGNDLAEDVLCDDGYAFMLAVERNVQNVALWLVFECQLASDEILRWSSRCRAREMGFESLALTLGLAFFTSGNEQSATPPVVSQWEKVLCKEKFDLKRLEKLAAVDSEQLKRDLFEDNYHFLREAISQNRKEVVEWLIDNYPHPYGYLHDDAVDHAMQCGLYDLAEIIDTQTGKMRLIGRVQ